MQKIITMAAPDWEHSIIKQETLDELFGASVRDRVLDPTWLEACKLVLVQQTTFFAWHMFDNCLSKREIRSARLHFNKFCKISENAGYRPPPFAISKIEGWIIEEERRARSHRPLTHIDVCLYPWLIQFHQVAFDTDLDKSSCAEFILHYFRVFRAALDSPDIFVPDPEGGERIFKVPRLFKDFETVRHAVHRYASDAEQHEPHIRLSVLDLVPEPLRRTKMQEEYT